MNKYLIIIIYILLILFGLFIIIFGEYDDSPGLQGIGLFLVITIIVIMIKKIKKNKHLL